MRGRDALSLGRQDLKGSFSYSSCCVQKDQDIGGGVGLVLSFPSLYPGPVPVKTQSSLLNCLYFLLQRNCKFIVKSERKTASFKIFFPYCWGSDPGPHQF